jgi:chromosome segregation protein
MLKIARMEISGFKSFSDVTEVVFPDGITAVVGPNGCGKSNIGDAINWVLGEQSARMMRGASMQDVIFNGTEGRKPVGMAEVSLHLAGRVNGDGLPPKTVTITRRLFRTGDSEYLLNGARSRLRDIQDLLREERVGAQTYATIEQGRIDQILNAKPKDRRLIIEEAAGVAGFKHKRRLAELKLEATQANLLRVNDIVLEVVRQINALKRQAAKARRYGRLRDELRAKESVRFGARAVRLDADLQRVRIEEGHARDAEAAASARLASLEAAIVEERTALSEDEREARVEAEALHELQTEIERGEARAAACRERIALSGEAELRSGEEIAALEARALAVEDDARSQAEALAAEEAAFAEAVRAQEETRRRVAEASEAREARRERVEALRRELFAAMNRLAELRNRRRSIEEEASRVAAQRERLTQERDAASGEHVRMAEEAAGLHARAEGQRRSVEELKAAAVEAEAALGAVRARLAAEMEASAAARERETSASAALRTLEDVATRFAGVSDGVRLVLTAGASSGVRTGGVVADFVRAARDVEGAAEAYLQGFLPAVLLEDDGDASRAAEMIRREGAGRTVLLCKTQPSGGLAVGVPANGSAPIPESMRSDPRVLGRLKDRITLRSGDGFVSDRIGDAVLVDSLESALALHRAWPHADYLAASGDVVYASGLIATGGRTTADHGLLAHNRKTADARAELAEATARAVALQERVDGLRADAEAAERVWADLRRAVESEGKRGAEMDLLARRTQDDRERSERRLALLAEEIAAIEADAVRLSAVVAAAAEDVLQAERVHAEAESLLHAEAASLEVEQAGLRLLLDAEAGARAEAAAGAQRVEAARRESARVAEMLAEIATRLAGSRAEREAALARAVEARAMLEATGAELALRWEDKRRRAIAATAREEALEARREGLQAQDAALKDERVALDAAREAARARELDRTKIEADRRFLDDLCLQELGIGAAEAARSAGDDALAAADEPALDAEISEIKAKVEAIGPVNLMAIDEFQSLEERHTVLAAQKKDLDDAIVSLRESIRRINRQSKSRWRPWRSCSPSSGTSRPPSACSTRWTPPWTSSTSAGSPACSPNTPSRRSSS